MDFAPIQLTPEQQGFSDELAMFLDRHLTRSVYARQQRVGDNHDEAFHRALAAKGWVMPHWPQELGGAGLDPVCVRILDLELERREAPRALLPMLRLIWPAVERYAAPDLVAGLRPRVADGSVRFCLGYTEPDGGSDIAAAKAKAVRDGDDWVISGAKTFTSNAGESQYCFLITRTDPDAPKHRGLTMFLVPLHLAGVEIQPMTMLGNTMTNTVYFADVRVPDRYRIGEVNQGWSVLHGPLDAEHAVGLELSGLEDISIGPGYLRWLLRAVEGAIAYAASTPAAGGTLLEEQSFQASLGQLAIEIEAALCTPGPAGRVKCSEVAIWGSRELISLVGPAGILPEGSDGAAGDGALELAHQTAQATAIYGGTTEVFRSMLAEHALGLPRPDFPGRKVFLTRSTPVPVNAATP